MLATAPGWELDVERGPDWLLVRIKGVDPDAEDSPLADRLWSLLERHFTYRLVLELDQIEVLNSHLVGQLVRLYKLIREHDGVLRLSGLSPYSLQVLHTCRLDDRLVPYPDRREAVLGCCRPHHPK